MVNRRQFPRVEYQRNVEIKLYSVEGQPDLAGRTFVGLTSDISQGGIGLRLDRDIPVGTKVKLRIFVHDPPSAFVNNAEVRWTLKDDEAKNFFIGVEFVGSSPEHMEEWLRLFRHIELLKKTSPP